MLFKFFKIVLINNLLRKFLLYFLIARKNMARGEILNKPSIVNLKLLLWGCSKLRNASNAEGAVPYVTHCLNALGIEVLQRAWEGA